MTAFLPYTPEQIKLIQDAKLTLPRDWARTLSDRIYNTHQVRYSNVYISQALMIKPKFYNSIIFNAFVDYKEELGTTFSSNMNRLKSSTYEPAK
jgi:predicted transcriptional regulator